MFDWNRMAFDSKEIIPIIFIILAFAIAAYAWPLVQEPMIIHWDDQGQADGYGSKFIGLLLMPIVLAGVYLLMTIIPYIAVFKQNLRDFYKYFFQFKLFFVVFMLSLYVITLLPNLGYRSFSMTYFMIPWIAILFFYLGHILKLCKRNFFMGIRTPWTLANDTVWKKTHELGSKAFALIGIIMLISLAFLEYAIYVMVVLIFAAIIFLFAYSFLEYRKIEKRVGEKKARHL